MRNVFAFLGFAAFALAQAATTSAASAAPVTLAPVAVSAEFQTALDEEFGAREGDVLRESVSRTVAAALTRHGATLSDGAPLVVEVIIVDADPNRPTFEQLGARPGLDMLRSISIGGAELRGTLRAADGHVVSEINHRRYNNSIVDLNGSESTWTDARRAIRQFAEKVADAYAANAR